MNLRGDLVEEKAVRATLENEQHNLLLQLHASQLQLHAKSGQNSDSDNIMKKLVRCPQDTCIVNCRCNRTILNCAA